jgi:hypothetical protein
MTDDTRMTPRAAGRPPRRRRIPWQVWYLLSALGFAVALLGQLGREWGWWNDREAVLTVAGFLLGVLSAVTGASDRTVVALSDRLDGLAGRLEHLSFILERDLGRIVQLLEGRLPPPSTR